MGAVSRLLVSFALHWRVLSSRLYVVFTIDPLPPGYSYIGPSGADDSDLCKCSTVGYSLISACGGCQGQSWITYDPCYCYILNSRVLCICIKLVGIFVQLYRDFTSLPVSFCLGRICWV